MEILSSDKNPIEYSFPNSNSEYFQCVDNIGGGDCLFHALWGSIHDPNHKIYYMTNRNDLQIYLPTNNYCPSKIDIFRKSLSEQLEKTCQNKSNENMLLEVLNNENIDNAEASTENILEKSISRIHTNGSWGTSKEIALIAEYMKIIILVTSSEDRETWTMYPIKKTNQEIQDFIYKRPVVFLLLNVSEESNCQTAIGYHYQYFRIIKKLPLLSEKCTSFMYLCTTYHTFSIEEQWNDAIKSFSSFINYCQIQYSKDNDFLQQIVHTIQIIIKTLSFSRAIEHLRNYYELYNCSGKKEQNILDLSMFEGEQISHFEYHMRIFNLLLFEWLFKMPCVSNLEDKTNIPSHIEPTKNIQKEHFLKNIKILIRIVSKQNVKEILLKNIETEEIIVKAFTNVDNICFSKKKKSIKKHTQKKYNHK